MLGAEHVLAELEQAVVDVGMRLDEPARRCQWRPRHGYAWTLEDKNVRGALFPGLDREFVVKRIASIARTLGIELATQVHECGSKVMLLSAHQMPLDVRMRRFFCMTRTA
jgi:hypothetical protein